MFAKTICLNLKALCLKHEWLQNLFALSGIVLMLLSIWFVMESYTVIISWAASNILLHGIALGIGAITDILLIFGLLCLGFSECSEEDKNCYFAYRGRRTRLDPSSMHWMDKMGKKRGE